MFSLSSSSPSDFLFARIVLSFLSSFLLSCLLLFSSSFFLFFLLPYLLLFYFPQPSLLDSYDYAMHGRVFGIKHIENQNIEVQASFGGLLCRLRGEQSQLESLQCDMM